MEKTINQKDLAGGVAASSITDEDIGDILARLHKTDFAGMNTRDMGMHAQVMVALLGKISKRHEQLVKLRDEVETRTQLAKDAEASSAEREDAASLAAMLGQLHGELSPPSKQARRGLLARFRRHLEL